MTHATDKKTERILIVDDQPDNVLLLELILEEDGYNDFVTTSDPRQVGDLYTAYQPDLVMLDLHMPHLSGVDVIIGLKGTGLDGSVPIVVLTGDISPHAKLEALRAGAKDFILKPFDTTEVRLRIRNLLETRALHLELRKHNQLLESRVAQRTSQLEDARAEILERLATAAEYRDDATGQHTRRVGESCARTAEQLGLSEQQIDLIRQAAPLHDVGKIGIPDRILLKAGRLTHDEFEMMKRHTVIGSRLLSRSISRSLRLAEQIALTHHERWDGTGYAGMEQGQIPLPGRILAVNDVFDALVHDRPYKEAWSEDDALEEIESQRGRHFDPQVVDAFMKIDRTIDLRDELSEPSTSAP
jgi:putative two-component system response regulator